MLNLRLFHTVHPGRPRTAFELLLELFEGGRGPRSHDLDPPVRQVCYLTTEPERLRLPRDEPAEPDPLNHAGNEPLCSPLRHSVPWDGFSRRRRMAYTTTIPVRTGRRMSVARVMYR